MIIIIVLALVGVVIGFAMGRASNGMSGPQMAFNIYTPILVAALGAIIGVIAAVLTGGVITSFALKGLAIGFVATIVGLVLARMLND